MSGKIKIHLMMLIAFMLCNASSMVLAVDTAITSEADTNMLQESAVSTGFRVEGDVVEMLPPESAVRTTSTLRGKRFEWLGQAENGVAKEERLNTVNSVLDFNVINID